MKHIIPVEAVSRLGWLTCDWWGIDQVREEVLLREHGGENTVERIELNIELWRESTATVTTASANTASGRRATGRAVVEVGGKVTELRWLEFDDITFKTRQLQEKYAKKKMIFGDENFKFSKKYYQDIFCNFVCETNKKLNPDWGWEQVERNILLFIKSKRWEHYDDKTSAKLVRSLLLWHSVLNISYNTFSISQNKLSNIIPIT